MLKDGEYMYPPARTREERVLTERDVEKNKSRNPRENELTVSTVDNLTDSICSEYHLLSHHIPILIVPVAGSVIRRITFAGLKAAKQDAWDKHNNYTSLLPHHSATLLSSLCLLI